MKNLFLKSAAILFISTLFIGSSYAQKVSGNGKVIEKNKICGKF